MGFDNDYHKARLHATSEINGSLATYDKQHSIAAHLCRSSHEFASMVHLLYDDGRTTSKVNLFQNQNRLPSATSARFLFRYGFLHAEHLSTGSLHKGDVERNAEEGQAAQALATIWTPVADCEQG